MADNNKQYIFILTTSGDRTSVHTWFNVISKASVINYIKTGESKRRESLRYAVIDADHACLLKQMRLDEFEECFEKDTFTPKEIEDFFCKDISEKYGTRKLLKEFKSIPKKELEVGCLYKARNGSYFLYLGKVQIKRTTSAYSNWAGRCFPDETVNVEGYKDLYLKDKDLSIALKGANECGFNEDLIFKGVFSNDYQGDTHTTKNPKSYIEKFDCKLKLSKVMCFDLYNCKFEFTFLDLKG